jgi:hypothetical protein
MDSESSEWKKRRTVKKDKIYECGCGKKYKVYSSLDSHIKAQHSGVVKSPLCSPQGLSSSPKSPPAVVPSKTRFTSWAAQLRISSVRSSCWPDCARGGKAPRAADYGKSTKGSRFISSSFDFRIQGR